MHHIETTGQRSDLHRPSPYQHDQTFTSAATAPDQGETPGVAAVAAGSPARRAAVFFVMPGFSARWLVRTDKLDELFAAVRGSIVAAHGELIEERAVKQENAGDVP